MRCSFIELHTARCRELAQTTPETLTLAMAKEKASTSYQLPVSWVPSSSAAEQPRDDKLLDLHSSISSFST